MLHVKLPFIQAFHFTIESLHIFRELGELLIDLWARLYLEVVVPLVRASYEKDYE